MNGRLSVAARLAWSATCVMLMASVLAVVPLSASSAQPLGREPDLDVCPPSGPLEDRDRMHQTIQDMVRCIPGRGWAIPDFQIRHLWSKATRSEAQTCYRPGSVPAWCYSDPSNESKRDRFPLHMSLDADGTPASVVEYTPDGSPRRGMWTRDSDEAYGSGHPPATVELHHVAINGRVNAMWFAQRPYLSYAELRGYWSCDWSDYLVPDEESSVEPLPGTWGIVKAGDLQTACNQARVNAADDSTSLVNVPVEPGAACWGSEAPSTGCDQGFQPAPFTVVSSTGVRSRVEVDVQGWRGVSAERFYVWQYLRPLPHFILLDGSGLVSEDGVDLPDLYDHPLDEVVPDIFVDPDREDPSDGGPGDPSDGGPSRSGPGTDDDDDVNEDSTGPPEDNPDGSPFENDPDETADDDVPDSEEILDAPEIALVDSECRLGMTMLVPNDASAVDLWRVRVWSVEGTDELLSDSTIRYDSIEDVIADDGSSKSISFLFEHEGGKMPAGTYRVEVVHAREGRTDDGKIYQAAHSPMAVSEDFTYTGKGEACFEWPAYTATLSMFDPSDVRHRGPRGSVVGSFSPAIDPGYGVSPGANVYFVVRGVPTSAELRASSDELVPPEQCSELDGDRFYVQVADPVDYQGVDSVDHQYNISRQFLESLSSSFGGWQWVAVRACMQPVRTTSDGELNPGPVAAAGDLLLIPPTRPRTWSGSLKATGGPHGDDGLVCAEESPVSYFVGRRQYLASRSPGAPLYRMAGWEDDAVAVSISMEYTSSSDGYESVSDNNVEWTATRTGRSSAWTVSATGALCFSDWDVHSSSHPDYDSTTDPESIRSDVARDYVTRSDGSLAVNRISGMPYFDYLAEWWAVNPCIDKVEGEVTVVSTFSYTEDLELPGSTGGFQVYDPALHDRTGFSLTGGSPWRRGGTALAAPSLTLTCDGDGPPIVENVDTCLDLGTCLPEDDDDDVVNDDSADDGGVGDPSVYLTSVTDQMTLFCKDTVLQVEPVYRFTDIHSLKMSNIIEYLRSQYLANQNWYKVKNTLTAAPDGDNALDYDVDDDHNVLFREITAPLIGVPAVTYERAVLRDRKSEFWAAAAAAMFPSGGGLGESSVLTRYGASSEAIRNDYANPRHENFAVLSYDDPWYVGFDSPLARSFAEVKSLVRSFMKTTVVYRYEVEELRDPSRPEHPTGNPKVRKEYVKSTVLTPSDPWVLVVIDHHEPYDASGKTSIGGSVIYTYSARIWVMDMPVLDHTAGPPLVESTRGGAPVSETFAALAGYRVPKYLLDSVVPVGLTALTSLFVPPPPAASMAALDYEWVEDSGGTTLLGLVQGYRSPTEVSFVHPSTDSGWRPRASSIGTMLANIVVPAMGANYPRSVQARSVWEVSGTGTNVRSTLEASDVVEVAGADIGYGLLVGLGEARLRGYYVPSALGCALQGHRSVEVPLDDSTVTVELPREGTPGILRLGDHHDSTRWGRIFFPAGRG